MSWKWHIGYKETGALNNKGEYRDLGQIPSWELNWSEAPAQAAPIPLSLLIGHP